jgi:hypothetical protein
MQVGAVRLQGRDLGADGDGLGDVADLHRRVHARDVVGDDRDLSGFERHEAGGADFDVVHAGREVEKFVRAAVVRFCGDRVAGSFVVDSDGRRDDGRLLRIGYIADQAPVKHLGRRRTDRQTENREQDS